MKQPQREESFVIDFSKQEELERQLEEQKFQDEIAKRVEDMIAAARNLNEQIKNVAVNTNTALKDDKNIDAEELYKEAERIQNELKSEQLTEDFGDADIRDKKEDKKEKNEEKYSGPSVLSYTLDNRKSTVLRIPAYKCYNSGDVTVIITVNRSGKVIKAEVLEAVSSNDECLKRASVEAAKRSWFNASDSAPKEQRGEILYRFIAQ